MITGAVVFALAALSVAAQECPEVASGAWDVAPCLRDSVPAAYPHMARLAGIEGTVCVRVAILASGVPCRVAAVNGPVQLHNAAIEAARKSRYTPASRSGTPVPGAIEIKYEFRLSDPAYARPDWPPADLRRPRVSDVAPATRITAGSGVAFEEYQFANVRVWGDVSVALCDSVLALIGAKLAPGEHIMLVKHYLALPRDWDPGYQWAWIDTGDLTVDVAAAPDSDGVVRKQRTYRFFEKNGTYELSEVVSLLRYD